MTCFSMSGVCFETVKVMLLKSNLKINITELKHCIYLFNRTPSIIRINQTKCKHRSYGNQYTF